MLRPWCREATGCRLLWFRWAAISNSFAASRSAENFARALRSRSPFEPGKPDRITFKLPDVAHTFREGHRIMVQIQSSWFPLTDRNPQKFMDIPKALVDRFREGDAACVFRRSGWIEDRVCGGAVVKGQPYGDAWGCECSHLPACSRMAVQPAYRTAMREHADRRLADFALGWIVKLLKNWCGR